MDVNYSSGGLTVTPVDSPVFCALLPNVLTLSEKLPYLDEIGRHTDDIEERSDYIIDLVRRNTHIDTIMTMDGHGRLYERLLRQLKNRVDINVYDICEDSHAWHIEHFESGSSYFEDIFDAIDREYDVNTIQSKLIYLNFCGIGGQSETIIGCIHKIKRKIPLDQIIVSFSTARAGMKNTRNLYNYLVSLDFKMLTNRTGFVTMVYSIYTAEDLKWDKLRLSGF
jgi:hypothetical protein